ncbi:MAG: AAA family ATPase [Bacteroidota bacterium]
MQQLEQQTHHFTREVLGHIHAYIAAKGFFYTKQDIANLFLCLRTKPFVILAGISGTGKTQLVRQFAAALGCAERCTLIPVRPDWADNSDLIGYTDLQGVFRRRAFLSAVVKAHAEPRFMHFVILDEMNLARVEHYFSDVLSILETRERKEDKIVTQELLSESELSSDHPSNRELLHLGIPDNLYLIGTVNMDETTYPFSRKVLDRANAIEMNEVHLDWPPEGEKVDPLSDVYNDFLRAPYVHLKDIPHDSRPQLKEAMQLLNEINRVLRQADLQFGYRVRDELAFYLLNRYEIRELISEQEALDFQIMQKILPRIYGSSRRVGDALYALTRLFVPKEIKLSPDMPVRALRKQIGEPKKQAFRFPRTIEKLLLMTRRYEEDGFTSFWI